MIAPMNRGLKPEVEISVKRLVSYLAMLTFCLMMPSSRHTPAASAQSDCNVWAYYMGFWTGEAAWRHQERVLSDRPLRGYYDTTDTGVAAAQIGEAMSAGIDAFIVDWWGPGEGSTTNALYNMLDRAAEHGFEVAASIDSFDGVHNVGRGAMADALRHLLDQTVNHPAYLHYQGRPVIFFAFQQRAGISPGEWQSLRSEVDPGRRATWIAEGTRDCPLCGGVMDGMYAFNMAWSNGNARMYTRDRDAVLGAGGTAYVPTIHPGWDESLVARRDGRPNPTTPRDREGGDFLRRLWSAAGATGSDIRLIVSWNEFIENSHIEPSDQYGSTYLDVVRELTRNCTGSSGDAGGGGGRGDLSPDDASRLTQEADARQLIQLNPGATLQQRIFRDRFVPNSGEFDLGASGQTWRGQRAEHLGTGQVRVYYAALGEWGNVQIVGRDRVRGDPEAALLAEGERLQQIQFHPGASLQKRIFADGFVPNSPEFRVSFGGREYAAQRAEHLGSGDVRAYYAPSDNFADVRSVTRPRGRTSVSLALPRFRGASRSWQLR